ncbi:hypothetical protein TVAG_460630 [Trichomonas vaginalis G3]|uniref:DUF3447 domain-containing protein n=1 Tax=Trichomonas vaginalis (strain ATCC PRA-98 / G3) TaxID=412133 RepID=A2DY37_TRIV3|nr:hypothetical protein TVAG_460630 [Trichomonas vaginalis G3]|eukprot:XP_001326869.1 hypothetical protein [Trichomonas vaginalis G3]
MPKKDNKPNKFDELRNEYKYYIDSYNALYQLKTDKEEELNSIYKMIKTELIDSKKHSPQDIINDILNIIPYKNRYAKSYLSLAKRIFDDYHVTEVRCVDSLPGFLFYKEYGINLRAYGYIYEDDEPEEFTIHTDDTIYRAIAENDKEKFIAFTQMEGFDKDQRLDNSLYPLSDDGFTLLELCYYHGAVDCFKFLRTKFNSEITQECLQLSFLGGNQEIMNECLKHQEPDDECMIYAIISHNIDFVTFLMNEHNLDIEDISCGKFKNLEALLVYYDQTDDVDTCFVFSTFLVYYHFANIFFHMVQKLMQRVYLMKMLYLLHHIIIIKIYSNFLFRTVQISI